MRRFLVLLFFVSLINISIARQTITRGRSKHGNVGEPILSKAYKLPKEQWFTQFLDHFNPIDAHVWKQVL